MALWVFPYKQRHFSARNLFNNAACLKWGSSRSLFFFFVLLMYIYKHTVRRGLTGAPVLSESVAERQIYDCTVYAGEQPKGFALSLRPTAEMAKTRVVLPSIS